MTPRLYAVAVALAGLNLSLAAAEDTVTVCSSGCDFTSINAAIEAANAGDVILMSAETYQEGTTIVVDKALTLRGAEYKGNSPSTVLDGNDLYRIIDASTSQSVTIEKIRFQNGFGDAASVAYNGGGAIYSGDNLTVRNCEFENNSTGDGSSGGAISAYFANGIGVNISDCVFTANTSTAEGGAIGLSRSFGNITDCTFNSNEVIGRFGGFGGAVHLQAADEQVAFIRCTFRGNSSSDTGEWPQYDGAGGAISSLNGTTSAIASCVFDENQADRGGAIFCGSSPSNQIASSAFTSNSGGAIYIENDESSFFLCEPDPFFNIVPSELSVINSTFTLNSVGPEFQGVNGTGITVSFTNLRIVTSTFKTNGEQDETEDVLILDRSECSSGNFSTELTAYNSVFQNNPGTIFAQFDTDVFLAGNTFCGTDQSVGLDDWIESLPGLEIPEDVLEGFGNTISESCEEPPSEGNPFDVNGDGIVDLQDIQEVQLEAGLCPGDINGDGQVDGQDLAAVLAAWGLPCDG